MVFYPILSILSSCFLRELFGSSWTKTLQYLVCQIAVLFLRSKGIFSVSLCKFQWIPSQFRFCLFVTFCCLFVELSHMYLLWILQLSQTVWNNFSPYFGWMSYFFSMCELSHISFNFSAELSYLILCDCQANVLSLLLKNHSSSFSCRPCITPTLSQLQLIPPHFLCGTVPILWVWMSQKYCILFLDCFSVDTLLRPDFVKTVTHFLHHFLRVWTAAH